MDVKDISPYFRGNPRRVKDAPKAMALGSYGGFVRMSHEYSVERGSIENHRMEIERLAAARGLTLSTWYILPAVSGKTIWDHPEVVRMRAEIEAGAVRGIVFTKLARLCRNVKELLEFRDFFDAHGAQMVCPEFNTADPGGRLVFTVLAAIAEMERENIAERVQASVRPRAARGLALGGPPKYGFRWVQNLGDSVQPWRLEQNPEEVAVIRDLLTTFLRIGSYRTAARELNKRHKTRKGFSWSDSRVLNILTEPIYRGSWIRNRTTFEGGRVREKDASEWVTVPIAPIFTPHEQARIDVAIARAQMNGNRVIRRQRYLLTQIWCGECQGRMYARMRKTTPLADYKCRQCAHGIPVADLDAMILNELAHIHENEAQIALLSKQLQENILRRERLRHEQDADHAALRLNEDTLAELARVAVSLGADGVKDESKRIQAECRTLHARIAELEEERTSYPEIDDITTFLDRVAQVPAMLARMENGREKFQMMAALIPKITVSREFIGYEVNFFRGLPDYSVHVRRTHVPAGG